MKLRRLDPVNDEALLRGAYEWDADRPQWYRDMDAVYGPDQFNAYIEAAKGEHRIDVGVFNDELIGVFVLSERLPDIFEVHVMAKRGIKVDVLAEAAYQVRCQLFAQGAKMISGWVASRNRPLIRLAQQSGFFANGISMLKGSYRGRVIRWRNFHCTRTDWLAEV